VKKNIITIILIASLAGGGVYSGIKISSMTEQINELTVSHATLQSEHDSIQSEFNSLSSEFNLLSNDYDNLQSDYNSLQADYNSLESDYDALHDAYYILQGGKSELEAGYWALEAENESLRQLLNQYEKVPHNYYSTRTFPYHQNTIDDLHMFLGSEFKLPTNYKLEIFDCSESASYVEWALENSGFDADIATGPIPWNPDSGYHAWVLVRFSNDTMIAIEPTELTGGMFSIYLGIVGWEDPYNSSWRNYYENYDSLYDNIYVAIRDWGTIEQWNWWEGYWGFI